MEPGVQMVIYREQNFTKNQKIAFLSSEDNRNMSKMKDLIEEMKDLTDFEFKVFIQFQLHFRRRQTIAFCCSDERAGDTEESNYIGNLFPFSRIKKLST